MEIRKCSICNNDVKMLTSRQKYCSDCRIIAEKERGLAWHKKNYKYKTKTDKPRICEYCGSTKDVWYYERRIMLCKSHYHEMYNSGKIRTEDEKGYKHNLIYTRNHIEIHFKNGEVGKFDLEDEDLVKSAYWGVDVAGYIHGKIKGRLARYHRHLFNHPKKVIDHIDGNKLDNRKSNLRLCTPKENSRNTKLAKNNTSGFTGVEITKAGNWQASITVDRKKITLGTYKDKSDAIESRKAGERKYFGEFAPNR